MNELTITGVTVTPVAFADPPLLNAMGVHEPLALRAVIQVHTAAGLEGLGECGGDADHLTRLRAAAVAIVGTDARDVNAVRARIATTLAGAVGADRHGLTGVATASGTIDRVFAPFEVACVDLQARAADVPVSRLLGGAVRDRVPYSAYLFYKWAGHPGGADDEWGAALDPNGIVAQARRMIDTYGFTAIKLKGGVFAPDEEITAVRALREAFPEHRLRLDPNAAWSVATSIRVGRRLDGILEYLEDPTAGRPAMAEVARQVAMPLATNMCVVSFDQVPDAIARGSVGIVLSDHHYWGGLRRSGLLAGICDTFGLGLSMHSNSHLGISLAAMTHLAAATPNLDYACDTHWPWKDPADDVIVPGVLSFVDGAVPVPTGPGLGVELDPDALARLHRRYLDGDVRTRDDGGYRTRIEAGWTPGRW